MTLHVEYMHAPHVATQYVNELQLAHDINIDNPDDQHVLVLRSDSDNAVVLTGTKQEVLALAGRIVAALAPKPEESRR